LVGWGGGYDNSLHYCDYISVDNRLYDWFHKCFYYWYHISVYNCIYDWLHKCFYYWYYFCLNHSVYIPEFHSNDSTSNSYKHLRV
jgi:hypothetical protein